MAQSLLLTPIFTLAEASEGNLFNYFGQSNLAGQIIVVMLMLVSVVAWSVMLGKYLDLRRMRMLNHLMEHKLLKAQTVFEINPGSKEGGPYASLVRGALQAHERFGSEAHNATLRMGHIENALQRAVANACIRYESKMVLLGSIVTAAPFVGLLGTVWGVMDAFGGMGSQSSATIQALAPGVSGALLTTVAGLVVAIPSVLGYNFLLTQTKIMVTQLENFASALADRVELELK